jgi:hypothetical protein
LGGVAPTEAIMTFDIANNEWDGAMQYNWMNLLIVTQHPMKSNQLHVQEFLLFQDKPDLYMHLV